VDDVVLRHVADVGAERLVLLVERAPVQEHAAAGGPQHAEDAHEERALAGPRGPEHAHQLARVDRHLDAVEEHPRLARAAIGDGEPHVHEIEADLGATGPGDLAVGAEHDLKTTESDALSRTRDGALPAHPLAIDERAVRRAEVLHHHRAVGLASEARVLARDRRVLKDEVVALGLATHVDDGLVELECLGGDLLRQRGAREPLRLVEQAQEKRYGQREGAQQDQRVGRDLRLGDPEALVVDVGAARCPEILERERAVLAALDELRVVRRDVGVVDHHITRGAAADGDRLPALGALVDPHHEAGDPGIGEGHRRRADPHVVREREGLLLDAVAVDVGAVRGPEVLDEERAARQATDARVASRDHRVIEHHAGQRRIAADDHLGGLLRGEDRQRCSGVERHGARGLLGAGDRSVHRARGNHARRRERELRSAGRRSRRTDAPGLPSGLNRRRSEAPAWCRRRHDARRAAPRRLHREPARSAERCALGKLRSASRTGEEHRAPRG
jgi:hypothetical protein